MKFVKQSRTNSNLYGKCRFFLPSYSEGSPSPTCVNLECLLPFPRHFKGSHSARDKVSLMDTLVLQSPGMGTLSLAALLSFHSVKDEKCRAIRCKKVRQLNSNVKFNFRSCGSAWKEPASGLWWCFTWSFICPPARVSTYLKMIPFRTHFCLLCCSVSWPFGFRTLMCCMWLESFFPLQFALGQEK